MVGDSAVIYGFSDALASQVQGERFVELMDRAQLKEMYLSPEWAKYFLEIRDNEIKTNQRILTPDAYILAALESSTMSSLDWMELEDLELIDSEFIRELEPQAKRMYKAHSGIHSMYRRQDRLKLAAEICLRSLSGNFNETTDLSTARFAASMYEELAWYDGFEGNIGNHYEVASRLNKQIRDSSEPWVTQFKIHSAFSLNDLKSFELCTDYRNGSVSRFRHAHNLRQNTDALCDSLLDVTNRVSDYWHTESLQLESIDDAMLKKESKAIIDGRVGAASGTTSEAVALTVVQDYLIDSGLYKKFWAKLSFIRQDLMRPSIVVIRSEDEKDKLDVLNITFDIDVYEITSPEGIDIPIEVKKVRGAKKTKLHPKIKIVNLNLRESEGNYFDFVTDFVTSRRDVHSSRPKSHLKDNAYQRIYNKVNPAELLKSLAA